MADISLLSPELQAVVKEAIHELQSHQRELLATRYLTAAGAVICLFELIASFPDERELIWKGRKGMERNLFLTHRHLVIPGLLAAAYMSAGLNRDMSDTACRVLLGFVGGLAAISICLADALVMIEVWQLWNCEWRVMRWMLAAYVLEAISTLGFMTATVFASVRGNGFTYQPLAQSCTLNVAPRWFAGSWASGLVFELIIFSCVIYNLLDRPRAGHVKLTQLLLRDGSAYFIPVIGLRMFNLVITSKSPSSSFLTPTFFTWAMVTVLVNRLVINQSRERRRLRFSVQMRDDLPPHTGISMNREVMVIRTDTYEMFDKASITIHANVSAPDVMSDIGPEGSIRSVTSVRTIHL